MQEAMEEDLRRNALSSTPYPLTLCGRLNAEIARLEKDIARLEGERGELETRLADPSTYEEGSDHVRESQQRHAEISRDLEVCEELWLERQTHLESLLDE